jgi:nitrous oxide reductase
VDGLFRSNATERDLGRRRVLALTALVGVSGIVGAGGLVVGLVPAGAGQVTAPTVDQPQPGLAPPQQPPVATSGSS